MRQAYDSDITREQFAHISEDLRSAKKRTSPRKVDLYDVFCANLYLLKMPAHGAAYLTTFQNGGLVAIITMFGQKRMKMVNLSLIMFRQN